METFKINFGFLPLLFTQWYEKIKKLFMAEPLPIFSFKKGDIIIRSKPSKAKRPSDDFRATPVEFIAIENNVLYVKELKPLVGIPEIPVYKLILEQYEEGWQLFKIPEGLTLKDCL